MSAADAPAAPTRRDIQQLVKSTSAKLSGRQRGPDRKVRRGSYDVDDRRAQVWSRIGDGTKRGGGRWRAALIKTAKEFDTLSKEHGKRGPLGPYAIRVLEELLDRGVDFATGRSEPQILTLMKWTRYAKATVVRALARLKAHGFLDWVRRTRKTDNEGEYGPQRAQTSNAYFFDLARMAKEVRQRFRDLLTRMTRQLDAADSPPPAASPAPQAAVSKEMAALLARMEANIASRESSDASS